MKKKQRVSMVVAQLLGLCLSLWSVSAMAECRTYNLYGDLWFSDRRVGTLSQAQWLTLGPAPNVEVQLVLSPGTLSFVDIESSQPSSWWCPSGVDCNSEDFDDYEGATNIYTDLDGHWAADVILCLREPPGEYGMQVRPVFKLQNAEWRVVDKDFDVSVVLGHTESFAGSDSIDFGITGVPWFNNKTELAMWVFQSMGEAWSFVEVDGGCSPERGFPEPCGFDVGGDRIDVRFIPNDADYLRSQCSCTACSGCSRYPLPEILTSSYRGIVMYHEYGHMAYDRTLRGFAGPMDNNLPPRFVHEEWGDFFEYAVVSNIGWLEPNSCTLETEGRAQQPDWIRGLVDLYDLHWDCALPSLGVDACDGTAHGIGQILYVFSQMSDTELQELRDFGSQINAAFTAPATTDDEKTALKRAYVEGYSKAWAREAITVWPTISWYGPALAEIFLMNCVIL